MDDLTRLIEILLAERDMSLDDILPSTDKPELFRALMNVREPLPVTEEFLTLQDRYLTAVAQKKGITDVNGFTYNKGIALWRGDITTLNADAIVNACNPYMLGCFQPLHNCIDNIIHSAAGVQVRLDCNDYMQSHGMRGKLQKNGEVFVTKGYNLSSKYIFHTVGPRIVGSVKQKDEADLESSYKSCFYKAEEMGLKTIAFCCISTGVYGYPEKAACDIAVGTVRRCLEGAETDLKVIFDVFTDESRRLYTAALSDGEPL